MHRMRRFRHHDASQRRGMTRPRSDRQIVAAAFRGHLTKSTRSMTDAYVSRLAREVRTARAEGRRPSRQGGRGHIPRMIGGRSVTTEHPKAYVRRGGAYLRPGDAEPADIRVSSADRHVAGSGVIVQRDFRSGSAAWRYLRKQGDAPVQAVAHGVPALTYATIAVRAVLPDSPEEKIWAVIYTGNGDGSPDENGQATDTYEAWKIALERIFDPSLKIDAYIVRRQD